MATEKKSTALSQPAQRPVSMSGFKGLLSNVTNPKPLEVTKQAAGQQQSTNSRKTLNKRATVFKDHLEPLTESKELTSKEPKPEPKEGNMKGHSKPSLAEHLQKDGKAEGTVASNEKLESEMCKLEVLLTQPGAEEDEKEFPDLEDDDCKVQPVPKQTGEAHIAADFNGPAISSRVTCKSTTVSRASQDDLPHQSEPEEYWDDDDEENEEDDGYITARSYRSRSENTTGGATTLLFPRYNQQVKRELALAKQIVEATRTVEDIEDDYCDTSMVAEYSEEIFEYMREQEVCTHIRNYQTGLSSRYLCRSRCCQMHIIWTTKPRSNGPCGLFSWTGLCRSTIGSHCSLKLFFFASTISTVSCHARLFRLASCSLLVRLLFLSPRNTKRSTVRLSRKLFTWLTAVTLSMKF